MTRVSSVYDKMRRLKLDQCFEIESLQHNFYIDLSVFIGDLFAVKA